MAIVQHLMTAWVWQGTAADRRTGYVQMTRAQYDAAVAEGRAQHPGVNRLDLKHIVNTLYVPPEPEPDPGRQGEDKPAGRRLLSRRRAAAEPPPADET